MQKKLVALAVASLAWAPFAAQAANVEIGGRMDLGVQMSESEAAGTTTKKTTVGIHNGAATSNVALTITEDLGGGMKVKGYIETDPALGTESGGTFAGSPNWLQLSGSFGAVTLGFMNNYALAASSASQPFGTGLASGYNGSFGRLDGLNIIGTPNNGGATPTTGAFVTAGGNGARDIRIRNSIQYQLPDMGAFSAGIIYKFKNKDSAANTVDAMGHVQIGASFSAGPLTVVGAHSTTEQDGNFSGTASNKNTNMMLGANYKLGAITIYGGYTKSDSSSDADVDSTSFNGAVKFQVNPAMALMANYVKVDDKRTADVDRQLIGFGLDYAMSKRTTAYVRYQSGDKNKAVDGTGDFSDIAVGLNHSF